MNTTILYSATRQWNPGDEFILYGVRRIFDAVAGRHNVVMYNRNPYINNIGRPDMQTFRNLTFENSWIDGGIVPDAVVLMGPEWYSVNCRSLYELVLRHRVPMYLLGVGTSYYDLSSVEVEAIKNHARVIVVRDDNALRCLSCYGAVLDTCPALFAAGYNRLRTEKRKVGISFHAGGYVCSPSQDLFSRLCRAWDMVYKENDVVLICHTYVDYCEAVSRYPDVEVFYSSLAEDYIQAYDGCDVVVGTRIHGIGLAASLGVPGIFISCDARAQAAQGFNAVFAEPEDVMDRLRCLDVQKVSNDLIELKKVVFERYVKKVGIGFNEKK